MVTPGRNGRTLHFIAKLGGPLAVCIALTSCSSSYDDDTTYTDVVTDYLHAVASSEPEDALKLTTFSPENVDNSFDWLGPVIPDEAWRIDGPLSVNDSIKSKVKVIAPVVAPDGATDTWMFELTSRGGKWLITNGIGVINLNISTTNSTADNVDFPAELEVNGEMVGADITGSELYGLLPGTYQMAVHYEDFAASSTASVAMIPYSQKDENSRETVLPIKPTPAASDSVSNVVNKFIDDCLINTTIIPPESTCPGPEIPKEIESRYGKDAVYEWDSVDLDVYNISIAKHSDDGLFKVSFQKGAEPIVSGVADPGGKAENFTAFLSDLTVSVRLDNGQLTVDPER